MAEISRRALLATGCAAGALAATGLGPRPARAQGLPTLRVGYQPYQYSAQVLYAQDQGFFTNAGLNVELQQVALGAALAAGVAGGALDIGLGTVVTIAIAHTKQIPFVFVAPGPEYKLSDKPRAFLMVANQSGIHSAKDMNGKTVATPGLATMGEYGVRAWVDANGGDSSTLRFVEMPFSQMPSAFASGRVDAGSIGEPFLAEARKVAYPVTQTMESAVAPDFMVTAWYATRPWAESHPDLVARFLAAIRAASAWAPKNPAACVDILARTFHIDPSTIDPALLSVFPQNLTPGLIQPQIDVVARYAKFPAFPAAEIIFSPRN